MGAIRISANLLMIGALFLAMYVAQTTYGSGTLTLCAGFFGISIPIWVVAIYLTKYVRRLAKKNSISYILLPGHDKPCLVEWTVVKK